MVKPSADAYKALIGREYPNVRIIPASIKVAQGCRQIAHEPIIRALMKRRNSWEAVYFINGLLSHHLIAVTH